MFNTKALSTSPRFSAGLVALIPAAGLFLAACAPAHYRGGANGSTAYTPSSAPSSTQASAAGATASPSPTGSAPTSTPAATPTTPNQVVTPTPAPAWTQVGAYAPNLAWAADFAVLSGETVTNTGPSVIHGSLGLSPGSAITGFPPGVFSGNLDAADAVALQAKADLTAAYLVLEGEPSTASLTGSDLGGLTLTKGVYTFTSSAQLTGQLVLDAQGDPNAVFVFQIGSSLTTASNSSVLVINGGHDCAVFWQVGSSATIGTGSHFAGNILALTSITLDTGAQVSGRVLARNGSVTLDNNDVNGLGCSALVCK